MRRQDAKARFDDYLEGQMPELEHRAFEEVVARDPELQEELSDYSEAIDLVRNLPMAEPPPGFYQKVRARIMRRNRKRRQDYNYGASILFEAVVCGFLIALLAALYLYVGSSTPVPSPTPSQKIDRVHLNSVDRTELAKWGHIQTVGTSILGSDLEVSMKLPTRQENEFRSALKGNTRLNLKETSLFRRGNVIFLKVRAPAGPVAPQALLMP